MAIEAQGSFIRLLCICGKHKQINLSKVKKGSDTQPVPVIAKSMSEEDIARARERLVEEAPTKEPTLGEIMSDALQRERG